MIRAAIMVITFFLSILFNRERNLLHTLALAAGKDPERDGDEDEGRRLHGFPPAPGTARGETPRDRGQPTSLG